MIGLNYITELFSTHKLVTTRINMDPK